MYFDMISYTRKWASGAKKQHLESSPGFKGSGVQPTIEIKSEC